MSLWLAHKTLRLKGFKMIQHYKACEIWEKGNKQVSIPNLDKLPFGIVSMIRGLK